MSLNRRQSAAGDCGFKHEGVRARPIVGAMPISDSKGPMEAPASSTSEASPVGPLHKVSSTLHLHLRGLPFHSF